MNKKEKVMILVVSLIFLSIVVRDALVFFNVIEGSMIEVNIPDRIPQKYDNIQDLLVEKNK